MAVTNSTTIATELLGLGEELSFSKTFSTTTTITKKAHNYQTQAVADTAEALNLGSVTTPQLIVMTCITNDVDVDCNYSASFSADITINEGETAVFKPAGTVYIKNDDAAEVSTVEYTVYGT